MISRASFSLCMKLLPLKFFVAATTVALLGQTAFAEDEKMAMPAAPTKAVAVLVPTEGMEVSGTIMFEQAGDGVKVTGEVKGLTPGKHGFHIHEFGDLTSADGKSAGGHFNPTNHEHAAPDAEMHHAGDLGNIEANAEGVATIEITEEALKMSGPTSILGRGLVVHAGEDDLKSQPSGEAGARAAVAVIGVAETK